MTHYMVSLFSGAGGLDLGFKSQGAFETILANDILPSAVDTYAHNFKIPECADFEATKALPKVTLGDVAHLDFSMMKDRRVAVLTGGPPCQDFSVVRGPHAERRGIDVKRGRLYLHFIRALAALKPAVFVFENVPGLINANQGLAYKTILEDFENLKSAGVSNSDGRLRYELIFNELVRFSTIGVPQNRRRLVIIGLRRDLAQGIGQDVLNRIKARIRTALTGQNMRFSTFPLTPIETFEGKILTELQEKYCEVMRQYDGIWDEVGSDPALIWKKEVWDKLHFDIVKDYLTANDTPGFSEVEFREAMREHKRVLEELEYIGKKLELKTRTNEDETVRQRMRMIPPDENHEFVRKTRWEVEGKGMSLIYRRLHPLKPSYTVVAHGGGGTWGYHYERERATLTNRERARLQTFPDSFSFKGKNGEIRAQIGEAVPPLGANRIAECVSRVLSHLEY